jgi:L,D-peptidoglycan transpeptidase YkuD (ErfK/YbiS/YcfS/YnhG family)|tara:strand:- start:3253 stop:3744 length:492 start_codon:yes stop_codon:yes gene_type:complete
MIIVNKNGMLIHKKKLYKCALGKKGITKNKREGDQKTPSGTFSLGKVFYRKDRTKNIKTKLKKYIIKKHMCWCDDPNSKFYNKLIFTKDKNKEKLFRKDNLYDIIIVINYNTRPIVKNKGSAIFIHLAKKNYSGTMGCIGLKKNDLLEVLKTISKKTKIKIVA